MVRFLGILLKISLQPVDGGGYPAYFATCDRTVEIAGGEKLKIIGSKGFINCLSPAFRMSVNRFKQIRGAFHPESKETGNFSADKCYQLRAAINELNAAARCNFIPESRFSFAKGG